MTVGEQSRRPIPCDNSHEVIASLTASLSSVVDKTCVLQRLWGVVHLDKSKIHIMINTTLPVLLQLRLSSPEVNYWLAAVLEEFTAFSSFVIHTQPTKVAFLNMLVKLLKVPDPANAFLDSKCTAANSVANLIQVSGEQAAHTIVVDSAGLVGHLCALLHVKSECAQHSSLRALWRLAYYSPTIRDEVSSHLASVCVITINKDIVQIVNNLQLILAPSQPLKV